MNHYLYEMGEYRILSYIGSGDGVSSLKHKLDCRMAESNAMVSHLVLNSPGKRLKQLIAERIAHVLAVTYIPFGRRGKTYVANILAESNKSIEENAREHALYLARHEHISDHDMEHIILGTHHFELDLYNIPIPTYKNLPRILFELEEMLDELNRCNLWPEDPRFSTRNNIMQYIRAHMEQTGKIILPDELFQNLTSKAFEDFENSPLTPVEEKYFKEYLNKVNFFSKVIE